MVSHKLHPALRNSRKQAERFYRPYLVHELRGPNAVELKGIPSRVPEVVNLSFIKPYYVSPPKFDARPQADEAIPILDGEEPEWEVEAIRDSRLTRRARRKFLIKWKGYPREDWVDLEAMTNSATLIIRYFSEKGEAIPNDVQDFFLQQHSLRVQSEEEE